MRKVLFGACALAALAIGVSAQAETVAVTNARILTAGPAGEIASGAVVFKDGKITAVGANVAAPAGARVIDAHGGVVAPGFFATGSLLGAVEVGSLGNDLSVNNPAIGASFDIQYGLNPESGLLPVARLGGLTSAVVLPLPVGGRGGEDYDQEDDDASKYTAGPGGEGSKSHALFAGTGAVIDLSGHETILTKAKVAMVVPFGRAGAGVAGGARGAEIVALKEALADVRAYMKNKAAYERAGYRDLALSRGDLEALVPVVEGRMPIVAVVRRASDIRQVLAFAREEHVKVILEGAEEGWMVAGEIAKAGAPVLLNPLNDRPESYEELAATMDNAGRLAAAGVTVALESTGGSARVRETRYGAGNAVSHGMSYAAALASVTINPARIFGVADRTGSLEPGKDADLVIWTGDPFEPLSQPTAVFIHGEAQPMTSRQIELRDRYRDLGRPLPPGYTHP
ncbi:MAG TPA: amidohydrolase family protein [Phenylobacterium sp.]|jgi:imidazolonepropionase-like amidohydrolase|uniref:amidohydrolase family protein n=1 Tax=Phenylobacterium sp. TaxID=1871053 RepID=UPI002B8AE3F2|nr:amidohydrolase family protein [Phenylobacterium sp.]HXA38152.1 amidohydrolase family protein [Phenylobacterium sp.]